MSIIVSPRTREIGTSKEMFFGFITVDDRPDVWDIAYPYPGSGVGAVYCIQSLCPDGSPRNALCQCAPAPNGGGIIFPGDPPISPTPAMPPVNEEPVQDQPPWWQIPGLFPQPTPQAHPIGAAGTTVVQQRGGNPIASLLLLAGIAAVGYYLYKKYRG